MINHNCYICNRRFVCVLCSSDTHQDCRQNSIFPRLTRDNKFICKRECYREYIRYYTIHQLRANHSVIEDKEANGQTNFAATTYGFPSNNNFY